MESVDYIFHVPQAKQIAGNLDVNQIDPLFDLAKQKSFLPLTVEMFLILRKSDVNAATKVFIKQDKEKPRIPVSVVYFGILLNTVPLIV